MEDVMQTVDYQYVKELQKRNAATLINVLSAEAFGKAHISGSINIPQEQDDFAQRVEDVIGDKGAPIVVYCASYSCDASKKAAVKLEKTGFTNVMCYEGGMKEWQEKSPRAA